MKFRSFLPGTAATLGLALSDGAESARPAAPAAYTQVPDSHAFPPGDLRIVALSDGTVPQDLHRLLTGTSPAEVDGLLERAFLANPVEASINAFLIENGSRRILVDTGSGQLFGPGNGGKLPDSLTAIGVAPGEITDILITPIHTDHSGGLALGGQPAFPNATVHVTATELAFYLDPGNAEETGYARRYFDEAARTIGVHAEATRSGPSRTRRRSSPASSRPSIPATRPAARSTRCGARTSRSPSSATSSTWRRCSSRTPPSRSSTTWTRTLPGTCAARPSRTSPRAVS